MNIDSIKKQASRLVEYLGEKHRVKLKHASALEAMAAVHGARNWQTLAAGAEPSEDRTVAASVGATGAPPASRSWALSWDSRGETHIELPRSQWLLNGIAFGDKAEAWVQDNLCYAAELGNSAMLFVPSQSLVGISLPSETPVVWADESAHIQCPDSPSLLIVKTDTVSSWLDCLWKLMAERIRRRNHSPLVIGLPALNSLDSEQLRLVLALTRQVRSVGVTFRCSAQSKEKLLEASDGNAVLAQMRHQLYMGNAVVSIQDEVLARLKAAPAVYMSSNSVQF